MILLIVNSSFSTFEQVLRQESLLADIKRIEEGIGRMHGRNVTHHDDDLGLCRVLCSKLHHYQKSIGNH